MTDTEYSDWARLHTDLFNMREPSDVRLFALWAPRLLQFGLAELREASYAIAEDPSDKARWRTNHLEMLRTFILGKRTEAEARERERQERQHAEADCPDCFGVGTVRVPLPRFIVDGELTQPFFFAVACECLAGVARFNAVNSRLSEMQAEHRLMNLAAYEAEQPEWRLIAAAYEERRKQESAAAEIARQADLAAPIAEIMARGRGSRS